MPAFSGNRHQTCCFQWLAGICLLFTVSMAQAQDFSYDGNRWYEIEISVFTNADINSPLSELSIPENTVLDYPENIRQLTPVSEPFEIDFETQNPEFGNLDPSNPGLTSEPLPGPQYSPPNDAFRVPDFRRDPFIGLSENHHQFDNHNTRIERSPDHRLLWHAVWRQPVLNRVQSTAIFVRGGDRYGQHNELEGSVMVSFNVNRVDIDAKLWRNFFAARDSNAQQWRIPAQPFPDVDDEGNFFPGINISEVHALNQVRSMTSNTLHYLDHPALGVLVEIRPYQLPDPFAL